MTSRNQDELPIQQDKESAKVKREESLSSKKNTSLSPSNMLKVAESGLKKSQILLANLNSPTPALGSNLSSINVKKSSMALAAFSNMDSPAMGDLVNVGPKIDASTANNIVIASRPVNVADRPQKWTKSTTKAADDGYRNPNDDGSKMSRKTSRGTLNSTQIQSLLENVAKKVKNDSVVSEQSDEEDLKEVRIFSPELSVAETSTAKLQAMTRRSSTLSQKNFSNEKTKEEDAQSINSKQQNLKSSRASLLVENLFQNIQSLSKPLRGPILLQLWVLYMIFLFILFISWSTKWADKIRVLTVFIYFTISSLISQFGRLAYAWNSNSVTPVYLSLFPFITLILISREAHATMFVLWFVSVGFIFLQSGHAYLRLHLISYYVLLITFYIIALAIMARFYRTGCLEWSCQDELTQPISTAFEAVIIFDSIMVMIGFLVLESFIKLNAITLLENDTYMTELAEANEKLKKQLSGDNGNDDGEVDLEAPLLRATQILSQIREDKDLDRMVKDEVDFIIDILSQDTEKLFKPDIYQKPADSEVHDWLNDMMLTEQSFAKIQSSMGLPESTTYSSNPSLDLKITPEDEIVFQTLSSNIDDPEFDIFSLQEITQGRCLYYVGWFLFRKLDFAHLMNMDENCFRRWMATVESGYLAKNPYHNAYHAADVTHSMYYYVSRPRIWERLKTEEKLAVILAPIIHDYNHPGYNNAFLISTKHSLALRYNDLGVLEHYHLASIYELCSESNLNIFSGFSSESYRLVREMIISMVLATDMAVHFDWIGKFKGKMAGNGIDFDNKQDKKLLLNVAMKCADINNPTKKLQYCRRWTDMIMDEFFKQGDEEKRLGLKVSMFMDRDTTDIPKCQGFIDFIVQPLYEAWSLFMKEDLAKHLANISNNKSFWKSASENPALLKNTS